METVKNVRALREIAEAEPEVEELLSDFSLSRKTVQALLEDDQCLLVGEKVIRNYRDKHCATPLQEAFETRDKLSAMTYELWKPRLEAAQESADRFRSIVEHPSYNYTIDTVVGREPVELSFTDIPGGAVGYKEYHEILGDVPTVDTLLNPFAEPIEIKQGKARSSKTIVIMPDLQAPLHDKELVDKFVDFLDDFQPSELAQTGDFTDSTEISRWVRGKKPEFAGDLQGGFDSAMDVLDLIRQVFDGRFRIVRSNHDDRLELYIQGCGPGLNFRDLTFEKQMHLAEFDVEFIRDGVVELTEDWIMGHGDEGSMSPQAGKTAFGLAKNKFGTNVVCGHTHRAGITSESYGYNGSIKRTLSGLEVGHFMDMKVADYLKKAGGHANWQQAFGILETINGKTFPTLVPVHQGNFAFEGQMY